VNETNESGLPPDLVRLVQAFQGELAAEVDVEPVAGGRYRLGVVSERFRAMPHLARQDLLWQIVDRTLTREQSLMISMILAFDPSDLHSAWGTT
jgi:stress-induced morphogen